VTPVEVLDRFVRATLFIIVVLFLIWGVSALICNWQYYRMLKLKNHPAVKGLHCACGMYTVGLEELELDGTTHTYRRCDMDA